MKIQKFNESVQNWTKSKIEQIYDEQNEMADLVLDYLYMHHSDKFEDDKKYYRLSEFWFDEEVSHTGGNRSFGVFYHHGGYGRKEYISYEFPDNEFQDLLSFMNNPEVYKDSKKYNL